MDDTANDPSGPAPTTGASQRRKLYARALCVLEWVRARATRRPVGLAAGIAAVLVAVAVIAWVGSSAPLEPVAEDPPGAPTAAPTDRSPLDEGDWEPLDVPPYEPTADLVPDETDGSAISADASFTLRSLTSIPAVELAEGLVADPHVELTIARGAAPDVATVRPAEPLVENARYRIDLRGRDGALAGSWTFRTGGPLEVVRRLPDDRTTGVPVDTGIEIEFNQDGVRDVASHFAIDPAVDGEFEVHGRTWAFIPAQRLEPATIYTITLTAGIGLEGSPRTMEAGLRFAFETEAPQSAGDKPVVIFEGPLHEARPGEAPVIPVTVGNNPGEGESVIRSVVLYGLPTLDSALDAAAALGENHGWGHWSSGARVATDGLTRAAAFDATVSVQHPNEHLQLPTGLEAGWYLLEVHQEGGTAQLVLQVTDLSAYLAASETRTIAWVNDLAADAPIAAAEVALATGPSLGTTSASGLLDVPTPSALLSKAPAEAGELLVVSGPDGRRMIAQLDLAGGFAPFWFREAPSTEWWLLFGTDRTQYRNDDTIRAWGLVRSRSDRRVPDDLELRLVHTEGPDGAYIERLPVTATERGVVVGELPVRGLPAGSYLVGLYVGGEPVTHSWVTVTTIRKPTFVVDVSTDKLAYIAGEAIEATIGTQFYDGSAAPGLELNVGASAVSGDSEQHVTAGSTGIAELTFRATTTAPTMETGGVHANPTRPEEGSSYGGTSFAVFPSTAWLEADASFDAGTLSVSGLLSRVDLEAAADQMAAAGWVDDPAGEPMAGRTIEARVEAVRWVPVQIGTTYDFLQKRTVAQYRYDREATPLGTFEPLSQADGTFTLDVPAPGEPDGIEVTLTALDEDGRRVQLGPIWAGEPLPERTSSSLPYLETPSWCGGASLHADIGNDVTLTVRSGDGSPDVTGRTLFLVSRLGIQDVLVTSEAELRHVLAAGDLPGVMVRAVRLSPAGLFVLNDTRITVDPDETLIDVAIDADAERYAPGQDVTLTITTTRPDGTPIAADVVVQAIDLKLVAIGAAAEVDTTGLMNPVASGLLGSYASHRVPSPGSDCGFGAATGGGEAPRDEFEDLATFQLVSTDVDGSGSAAFPLPDDLTSWAVTATAFGDGLEAGTHTIDVPVGLPFFVDATIAPEYLAGEAPIIQIQAYGDALTEGDPVRFTIDAPSLDIDGTAIEGEAFTPVRAALPALTLGAHEITISAELLGGGPEMTDAVIRAVRVVPTRLRAFQTAYDTVAGTFEPPGGDGLTSYVVTDAGRGALLPALNHLAWSSSARFDATMAAELARRILMEDFGVSEADLPASGFSGALGHPPDGLALLPHASADLFLTARAALVAPELLEAEHIRQALSAIAEGDTSRERRIVALAGLAGVGEEVLGELRAVEREKLTLREQVWLALGLLAAGDEPAAREIERAILDAHGQRLGRWVRLDIGIDSPETAETTASALLLAAGLRDPLSVDISRYLLDHAPTEHLPALEQIGFVRAAVEWLPRAEARFGWILNGERSEQTLEAGASLTLTLTAAQQAGFVLEPIEGEIMVASTWAHEAHYEQLPDDPSVQIRRTVSPADHAPPDALVRVTLDVTLTGRKLSGCYQVTDLLPSGLAPVAEPLHGWGASETAPDVIAPYEVVGQRVSWCVSPDRSSVRLGYAARVVSAGSYLWEPAVIQAIAAAEIGSATDAVTFTID